jgi:hypothetical protein
MEAHRESGGGYSTDGAADKPKKLQKSFEKGIDKRGRKWYNNKVARKRGKTDH